jgi:hypothetical protein
LAARKPQTWPHFSRFALFLSEHNLGLAGTLTLSPPAQLRINFTLRAPGESISYKTQKLDCELTVKHKELSFTTPEDQSPRGTNYPLLVFGASRIILIYNIVT